MGLDIDKYLSERGGLTAPIQKQTFHLVLRTVPSFEIEGQPNQTGEVPPVAENPTVRVDIEDMKRSGTFPCWSVSVGVVLAVAKCGLFSFVGSCTPYPARTVQIDAMEGAERTGLRRYAPVVVLGSDWERFGVPFVKEVESNPSWVSLLQ